MAQIILRNKATGEEIPLGKGQEDLDWLTQSHFERRRYEVSDKTLAEYRVRADGLHWYLANSYEVIQRKNHPLACGHLFIGEPEYSPISWVCRYCDTRTDSYEHAKSWNERPIIAAMHR